jgi:predicted GNAT family N-acyltransferase
MTVRPIQPEELPACFEVRVRVFVDEQKVPFEEEIDAYDGVAQHFAALDDDGKVVGTARLIDAGDGIGKVGRVAVLQEARGKGSGREIMLCVMREGYQRFHTLKLDAQLQVIPFYENLGFVAEGEVFLDAGIEHRLMKRRKDIDP